MPEIKQDLRTATMIVAADDSLHKNMADYVCDGTADNVEIQAALDALPATGGEVHLLDGTYVIADDIVLDSYQTLSGCGSNTILSTTVAGCKVLKALGGSGTEKIGIVVSNLALTSSTPGTTVAIYCEYVDHSTFENLWITGFDDQGIYLEHSDENRIMDSHVEGDVGCDGFELYDCEHNIISGNFVDGCDEGIYLAGDCLHCVISANTCHDAYDACIFVLNSSDYTSITGNTCEEGDMGIEVYGAAHCTVSGNVCNNQSMYGIYANGDYIAVTGNIVTNSAYQGIMSNGSIVYGTFIGNIIHTTGADGIELSPADYCEVSNNLIYLAGHHGILIDDAWHGLIDGNYIESASQATDATYDGIRVEGTWGDYNTIINNRIRQGTEANKPAYGINISAATCQQNRVMDNDLYDSGKTGAFNDSGTDTILPFIYEPIHNPDAFIGNHPALDLPDNAVTTTRLSLFVPAQFVELVRIHVLVVAAASGNLNYDVDTDYGEVCADEDYNTHGAAVADQLHACTINDIECVDLIPATTLASLAARDLVGIEFSRDGVVGTDTIAEHVYLIGVRLQYV